MQVLKIILGFRLSTFSFLSLLIFLILSSCNNQKTTKIEREINGYKVIGQYATGVNVLDTVSLIDRETLGEIDIYMRHPKRVGSWYFYKEGKLYAKVEFDNNDLLHKLEKYYGIQTKLLDYIEYDTISIVKKQ